MTPQQENKTVWLEMTGREMYFTMKTMRSHGGGFASAIGEALMLADPGNMGRLAAAFPDLIERYGPGSEPYRMASGGTQ